MLGAEMSVRMACKRDGCSTEKRDPCASPPCKRLKQAPLAFQIIIDDDDDEKTTGKHNDVTPAKHTSPSEQSKEASVSDNCDETTAMETETVIEANTTEKTNSPLALANFKEEAPVMNTSEANSDFSSPKSTNESNDVHKSPTSSSTVGVNCGSILKFMQPVAPGQQADRNVLKTPSKSSEDTTVVKPSTPVNDVDHGSPGSPTISNQSESPGPASTPGNKEMNTPKARTPARKLGVEEKLKREEERTRKQKERQEAKQKKEQERLEQQELKKQREKEKQDKKEQEEKEKKEKLGKKDEEKKKKDDEKKRKEDEKNLKNEEKRKKEEEQNLKKRKVQNSFASFFIKKEVTSPKQKEQVKNESKFQPFELKSFMKLASTKPSLPLSEEARETLGKVLAEQVTRCTSIPQVKDEFQTINDELARQRQMKDESARNITDVTKDDDEVMIIDQEAPDDDDDATKTTSEKHCVNGVKPKLLQFHDNYRPAYFGTWRKKSLCVRPKHPFKKDVDLINYEVDSDEEWEEEEPGESLSNSEGEDEDNDGNGNDEENDGENDGFFVPHGYLSDDEGVENIEEDESEDCKDGEEVKKLPQQHKEEDRMQRQLAKQKVWETEMKRQFKPMRPIAIGCIWDGEIPSILKQLEACSLCSGIIDPCIRKDNPVTSSPSPNPSTFSNTAMPVPEEAIPALIKLVHGNTAGLNKLVNIFRKKWTLETKKADTISEANWGEHCLISKRQLERKITSIAKKEKRPMVPKARWYVHDSVLDRYKIENSSLKINGFIDHQIEETTSPLRKLAPSTPTIKQFTKNAKSLSPGQNGSILLVSTPTITPKSLSPGQNGSIPLIQTSVMEAESMDTGPV